MPRPSNGRSSRSSRIPVRRPTHGARRRSDQAAAGQPAHRAHHRRERHGQGAGGAIDPRRLAAGECDVPPLQLHDDHQGSCRQPAVRASARQLHRRRLGSARTDSIRRGGNTVPRRDRRSAGRRSTQAAAISRAGRDHADRRDAADRRRRPDAGSHQCRSRTAGRRRPVPRGLLLPAERDPHPRAAAARATRRDPPPHELLPARSVRR